VGRHYAQWRNRVNAGAAQIVIKLLIHGKITVQPIFGLGVLQPSFAPPTSFNTDEADTAADRVYGKIIAWVPCQGTDVCRCDKLSLP